MTSPNKEVCGSPKFHSGNGDYWMEHGDADSKARAAQICCHKIKGSKLGSVEGIIRQRDY